MRRAKAMKRVLARKEGRSETKNREKQKPLKQRRKQPNILRLKRRQTDPRLW